MHCFIAVVSLAIQFKELIVGLVGVLAYHVLSDLLTKVSSVAWEVIVAFAGDGSDEVWRKSMHHRGHIFLIIIVTSWMATSLCHTNSTDPY